MRNKYNRADIPYGITPDEPQALPPSPYIRHIDYGPEEDVHLRDYLSVILKRKWIVTIFLIAVVVSSAVLTSTMTPLYKSTVVIKIDKEAPNILSFKGVEIAGSGVDYYTTQYEILKSRSLAEKVIRRLNLDKNNDFLPVRSKLSELKNTIFNATSNLFSFIGSKDRAKEQHDNQGPVIKEEIPLYLINSLINRLEITPVKNSQLVKVSFMSHNPELSMNVANAMAEAYIDYDLESRVDASKKARVFLVNQIENTKAKVESSEKKLNAYASKNTVIFLDGDNQSILNKKIAEVSAALSGATTERMQKEAIYREIKESGTENPAILNNPLIQGLKNKKASLETKYINLSKALTPDHPEMINLKSEISATQDVIEQEKFNLITSIESDYKTAINQEENLREEFEAQQERVLDFQERTVQYQILKREVEINKGLYNNLLQRLNEVGVTAMSTATSIQVVDKAIYPRAPYKPNKPRNFLLSIVFGLMGGVGLAFLVEYFDNTTINDAQEIERGMHLTSLGMIPFHKELNAVNRPHIIYSDTPNPIAEAFRSISTFILLSSSSKPPRIILVTSPGEKEGKTTCSINIAKALAETLGNGVIIDADLRRPKLHNSFGLDNEFGLSTSGDIEFEGIDKILIKPTSVRGLNVITAGPVIPNPSELLCSSRVKDLLDALYTMYDFVIIDAPPILGLPDSVYLSSLVDATVLVVRAGETSRNALVETKRILNNVHARLLGVVLTGVKKDDLKYGYYSYYSSHYFKE